MLTRDEAVKVVTEYLKKIKTVPKIDLVLLEKGTLEFELGWVFLYQSKKYVETGDVFSALGGNGAIIVDKHDGNIHQTGTGQPVEYYIAEYIQKTKSHNPAL